MTPAASRGRLITNCVMLLVLAAVFSGSSAEAQRLRIIPVPPNVKPQWTPMPDLPQVSHAPNIPTDVFRYGGRYYFYWEGSWYQSKNIKGPWNLTANPPAILSNIQAAYFKTIPRAGGQPPSATAPGAPPPEGMVTPEGKQVVPPPPETPQPPPTAQPPEQEPPAMAPEQAEPAPPAVPEGPLPKVM